MKITITLEAADAQTLIKLLAQHKDAAEIVSALKSALTKDKAAAANRQIL